MSAVDTLLAYKFIKLLTTKFENWDAYKLGIIDENGDVVKSPSTSEEKKAYSLFHKLVKNIKKLIHTAPLGRLQIASMAVALRLLKEETGEDLSDLITSTYPEITPLPISEEEDNSIPQGKYILDNHVLSVKITQLPEDNILGVNIYELRDVLSGEKVFASKEQLCGSPNQEKI